MSQQNFNLQGSIFETEELEDFFIEQYYIENYTEFIDQNEHEIRNWRNKMKIDLDVLITC